MILAQNWPILFNLGPKFGPGCEISFLYHFLPAVQINNQSHDYIFTTTNYGNSIMETLFFKTPFPSLYSISELIRTFIPHLYKSSHKSEFSGYLQFIAQTITVLHNILF